MPMFDDPKKELQRLEEQLLQEEEWFARELDSAKAMIGEVPGKKGKKPAPKSAPQTTASRKADPQVRNFANGYGGDPVPGTVRNTDAIPEKKKPQPQKKKKGIKGLVTLAILETLGIVGIVAYWLLFLL